MIIGITLAVENLRYFSLKKCVSHFYISFINSMNSAKIDKNFQDEGYPIFILVFGILFETHAQNFINLNKYETRTIR